MPAWVSEKGNGYSQTFLVTCPRCQLGITHGALGVGRLAYDLSLKHPKILMFNKSTLGLSEARSCLAYVSSTACCGMSLTRSLFRSGTLAVPRETAAQEGFSRVAAARFKTGVIKSIGTIPVTAGLGEQIGRAHV